MGTVLVKLYLAGAWVDVSSYVRQDPPMQIVHGVRNEGATADSSTVTVSVNNTDGRFTPRNTAGAYYGNLKRGTPIWITYDGSWRFVGEVAEFPVVFDESGQDVVTTLVGSGILRRLQRAKSLSSTLSTAVLSLGSAIVGYWPMEDEVGSSVFATPLTGGTPATFNNAVLSAVDLSAGTHEVPTFAGANALFTPAAAVSSTAFTAGFYVKLPTSGLTGGEELFRVDVDGSAKSWRVLYSPASGGAVFLQVIADDPAGTELLASSNIAGLDGQTFYVKLEVSQSGANVAWSFSTLGAGTTLSGTILTRTVGEPMSAAIGYGVIAIPTNAAVAIGHVILANTSTALSSPVFDSGRAGYAGESIESRLSRVASTTGIAITTVSGAAAPTEMGPQPDGTVLEVLRAAEKADAGGILTDNILSAIGLRYITRNARYNDQQPQLVLDWPSGHLTPPVSPTDDDQQLRNDVTANRIGGSSARAVLTSGALSTAAYPGGVGPYPFEDSYGVYTDAQLPYLAQWLLALGTIDETRFPAVTVDLVKNPSLVAGAEALRVGSRLRITNLPAYAGATNVDLQVIGWTETITAARRDITFVCTPGSVWLSTFELDDTVFGTLDDNRLGY